MKNMSYKSKYIFIYHLGHILKCKKASQIAAYGQFNSLDTLIFLLLVRTTIRIQMSSSNYQRIPRTRWSVLSAMPSVSYLIHEYLRAPGHQCDSFFAVWQKWYKLKLILYANWHEFLSLIFFSKGSINSRVFQNIRTFWNDFMLQASQG